MLLQHVLLVAVICGCSGVANGPDSPRTLVPHPHEGESVGLALRAQPTATAIQADASDVHTPGPGMSETCTDDHDLGVALSPPILGVVYRALPDMPRESQSACFR